MKQTTATRSRSGVGVIARGHYTAVAAGLVGRNIIACKTNGSSAPLSEAGLSCTYPVNKRPRDDQKHKYTSRMILLDAALALLSKFAAGSGEKPKLWRGTLEPIFVSWMEFIASPDAALLDKEMLPRMFKLEEWGETREWW